MNKDWRRAKCSEESTAAYLKMGSTLSKLVIAHGIGDADGAYAFNGEALELLQFCRNRGIVTVLEQTIAPKEMEVQLLSEEAEAHPEWVMSAPQKNRLLPEFLARQHAEWDYADLIVCGSEFVRNGIRALGKTKTQVMVVPYGIDSSFSIKERTPHKGPLRVLTVGTVNARKGIPYLYDVARILYGRAEFRVVGSIEIPKKALDKLLRYVQVVDRVPRSEIVTHYAWADVFLLPSLCEGSAVASYEALSAGLPVLATPNAGTVVRDGVDGFVFPVRDTATIVRKLEQCASEPDLVDMLSENARRAAAQFTLEDYASRLMQTLQASFP